jgi:hypothetical protein
VPDNDWERMADRHGGPLPLQEGIHLPFVHTHSLLTPKLSQQAQDPPSCKRRTTAGSFRRSKLWRDNTVR